MFVQLLLTLAYISQESKGWSITLWSLLNKRPKFFDEQLQRKVLVSLFTHFAFDASLHRPVGRWLSPPIAVLNHAVKITFDSQRTNAGIAREFGLNVPTFQSHCARVKRLIEHDRSVTEM